MVLKKLLILVLFFLLTVEVAEAQTQRRQSFQRGSILTQKRLGASPVSQGGQLKPRSQSQNAFNSNNFNSVKQTRINSGRAKTLYQVQSILSYISNGFLIVGCALGGPVMFFGLVQLACGATDGVIKVVLGLFGIVGGLATPFCIDLLFKFACDNSLI